MIEWATWLVAVAVAAYAALVAVYAVALLVVVGIVVGVLVLGAPVALVAVACDAWRDARARRRATAPRPRREALPQLLGRLRYTTRSDPR